MPNTELGVHTHRYLSTHKILLKCAAQACQKKIRPYMSRYFLSGLMDITVRVERSTSESIWPSHAFADGKGINVLTGADPIAPVGGAAFHDNRIWI